MVRRAVSPVDDPLADRVRSGIDDGAEVQYVLLALADTVLTGDCDHGGHIADHDLELGHSLGTVIVGYGQRGQVPAVVSISVGHALQIDRVLRRRAVAEIPNVAQHITRPSRVGHMSSEVQLLSFVAL